MGAASLGAGLASLLIPGTIKPSQGAQLAEALARKQETIEPVFHGSPHDFDRFSMQNIGTGEGAQAYGHGMYFADSEDVARIYRDKLTPSPGVEAGPYTTKLQYKSEVFERVMQKHPEANRAEVARMAENYTNAYWARAEKFKDEKDAVLHKAWLDGQREFEGRLVNNPAYNSSGAGLYALDEIADMPTPKWVETPGRMYQTRIKASPDELLDWDAPIADMPQAIQNKILDFLAANNIQAGNTATGATIYQRLEAQPHLIPGFKVGTDSSAAAARALKEIGIKGIRYFDGFSRKSGEGSRNYVVFDDDTLEIIKKYGLLPLIGGAAAGAVLGPDQAMAGPGL